MVDWKYTRITGQIQVSKWIKGLSWVTKYDSEDYCYIGVEGAPRSNTDKIVTPKKARELVERLMEE